MEVPLYLDFDFEAVDIWTSTPKSRCPNTQNSLPHSSSWYSSIIGRAEVTFLFNKIWREEWELNRTLCSPSPGLTHASLLLNEGIFHLYHFHLWNMIFHKLCEMDFVPFTLHELLSHFPDLPEFAHSWKRIFKSWEMIVFSVDFCCPQKVSGSLQWLSTWERKIVPEGMLRQATLLFTG